jgi:hypothetical protein
MSERKPLPQAFTRDSNPKRSGALKEELAAKPRSVRLYEIDDASLAAEVNASDALREIVKAHYRGATPPQSAT